MKLILELNLDFKQFQNLIILTFISSMMLFGMLNSVNFSSNILVVFALIIINIFFVAILLTKKGLLLEKKQFFVCVFLFGFALKKTIIKTASYKEITILQGKLSTNYNYSFDIKEFHNWEPNLNHSVTSFTIYMKNESQKQKILMLTKPENVKLAITFITKNTMLIY